MRVRVRARLAPSEYHQSRRVYSGCVAGGREASTARSSATELISRTPGGRAEATEARGSTWSGVRLGADTQ